MEKLIRDRIPEIAALKGQQLNVRVADESEMHGLLLRKLMEEAQELTEAATIGDLLEEAADVIEVIMAIVWENEQSFEALAHARVGKLIERGGFVKRLVLEMDSDA